MVKGRDERDRDAGNGIGGSRSVVVELGTCKSTYKIY
jgi:hypothetical protein